MKSAQKAGIQSRSTYAGPAIVAAIFLALHLLPLVWRPNPLWGVDFLFYLPAPVQALFALLAVLLFIPAVRRQIRSRVGALPFALWGRGQRVWITRALVALLALAAFIALSSATHLLGDGYGVLTKLDRGDWPDRYRAPLAYALIEALYRAGSVLWLSAENTYRIYSYVSGILFVLLAFKVADVTGKTDRDKSVVLACVFSAGYMQLFFGYVENYALYMPGLLLFILVGLQTWRQRLPLYVPAIVLGVLLALHPANMVFGPSLLFLSFHDYNNRKDRVTRWKNITATVSSLCCGPICAALFLWLCGIGVDAYVGGTGVDEFLPLFAEPTFLEQHRIFSVTHILDFLNQQLLAAPAACMILFLLRRKDLRHQPFLAVCTVVPLFFTFIANPKIGAFRDWDVFSIPALPMTLWAATSVLNRIRDRERLFHGAFVICYAGALHTLLWIGVNANTAAAEARFAHQATRLDKNAGSYSWSTLGNYYASQGRNDLGLNAFKRAIEASPENPWHFLSIARVYRGLGQDQLAIDHARRALEIRPDFPEAHTALGATYLNAGRNTLAISHFKKSIELQPDVAVSYLNLGAGYSLIGQFDKAVEHLKSAVALDPELATAHQNLGAIYRVTGELYKAIGTLERAVALEPQHAPSHAHLGAAYRDAGQRDRAILHLEKAVEIRPDHVDANVDLGVVYNILGKYPMALERFEKALELQGDRANAMTYLNIGHTYYMMQRHDMAIPYFEKAIQRNPSEANAHLLLGLSYRALKRGDEARACFEKTLELEPGHPQASQIRRWMGKSEE